MKCRITPKRMISTCSNPFLLLWYRAGSARGEAEHRDQVHADGRGVRVAWHDVLHVLPPTLHQHSAGQRVEAVRVLVGHHGEQGVAGLVEEDPVVHHASIAQGLGQFGPDLGVAPTVLIVLARVEVHAKGSGLHYWPPWGGVGL